MPVKLRALASAAYHVARQWLQFPLLIITKQILSSSTRRYKSLAQAQVAVACVVAIDEFKVLMHIDTRDRPP